MAGGTSGSGSLWFSAAKVWKVNEDDYCQSKFWKQLFAHRLWQKMILHVLEWRVVEVAVHMCYHQSQAVESVLNLCEKVKFYF